MRSFQIFLRLKQAAIVLICALGFTASQLSFVGATFAVPVGGGGGPYVTISSPNIEINVHGCATIPVDGERFTPASKVDLAVSVPGSNGPDLPVSPTSVSVAANGNFFIPLYVCKLSGIVTNSSGENLLLTAVDAASGLTIRPVTFNVSVPVPSLYSNNSTSSLLNDCGTVVIFGNGFVASTAKANYASISAFETAGGTQLRGSARANVLVNGNIALSVQFCGLKVGDTFFVRAVDVATQQKSDIVSFTAVEATSTPQPMTPMPMMG